MLKVNILRSRMAIKEISQRKLAEEIGISKNTMSSRMTCRSSFTLEEVDKICGILGIVDILERRLIFLS